MNQGLVNTVVAAVVGGVIGASVVFFAGGKTNPKDIELDTLRVASLTITKEASLLNKEGTQAEVVIRDGNVVAENVIFGKKVIGRQVQGHAFVANRMFTTPDDTFTTAMENWKFFTEIGCSAESGGEIVVRSPGGGSMVNRPTNNGSLFRMGYDPERRPQMLGLLNDQNRTPLVINMELSEMQRQEILRQAMNPQGAAMPNVASPVNPGSFDGRSATPADPNRMQ